MSDETGHAMWFYSTVLSWCITFSLESVSHLSGSWGNITGVGANFITNHVVPSAPPSNPSHLKTFALDKPIVSVRPLMTRAHVNTPN